MEGPRYLFGLIGFPLGHSFSQQYMRQKIGMCGMDADYVLYPMEEVRELDAILKAHPNLVGLNVTIPHKEQVIPFLDELDPVAHRIGAVNTVLNRDGSLKGFNTDYTGFSTSLVSWLDRGIRSALILGTGGAAKAVEAALDDLEISCTLVSRTSQTGALTYADCTEALVRETRLIINTTPLGMHPEVESCPSIPYHALTPQHYLFDLVYNPEKTLFLKRGEKQDAHIKNGLEMLHLQADHAWEIWKSYLDGTHGRS
jgi:shikimate dehydrogenase